ncbi:unnamed protein product [Adineta ricciae]|uniref:F-box domain-containing protein n=1 Tax=Adineta ricciae TaxID=249248 RepID=A0A815GUU6_ADIRI|nr:unnamed protein product [Adineta ricciae]CAF1343708.1 unnamed protein product [Adineta ricciae]
MRRNKRPRTDTSVDYNNNKRQKSDTSAIETNLSSHKRISSLEDLSNELFYEIFDYLLDHHAFQAFYDLNNRFQSLFLHSNFPIHINISSISKAALQHYVSQIIKPCTSRIESFRLSNPCIDLCSLFVPLMKKFTQLSTLVLNHIDANHVEKLLIHLQSLPVLSSLTLVSINHLTDKSNIYAKLLPLPNMKYCEICIETLQCPKSFVAATHIEHFVINHEISIDQLFILLPCVPQIRRLSIGNLKESRTNLIGKCSISLPHLINVSLKSNVHRNISFDEFEALVSNCFHQVDVLNVEVQFIGFGLDDREFINATRWQRLITSSMPNLRVFDFRYSYRGIDYNVEYQTFETLTNKFNAKFWTDRQWFFDRHYHKKTWSNAVIFYSRNPYQRKNYVLHDELTENIWSTRFDLNADPTHHICVHRTSIFDKPIGQFPYATKLTLCETFEVPRLPIVNGLNRAFPLQQLTNLSIQCHHFAFHQLIELFRFTTNVQTLTLDSIVLYRADASSIQRNEVFQSVSKANSVRKITISKEITLEKMRLVIAAFPRMEDLTINLFFPDLKPIAQYLLTNARHLSALCISKQRNDLVRTLQSLIKSKKLLRDYVLKVFNGKLYLWL